MNKTVKWILIVLLIIVVLAIIILAVQYFSKPEVLPGTNPNPAPDPSNVGTGVQDILSGWIKKLFGGGGMSDPACQKNDPGFDNNGYYTTKCGGVPGGGGANCDPANPGKDMNGFGASQCGG